jgi:tRNA-intron endonuclease
MKYNLMLLIKMNDNNNNNQMENENQEELEKQPEIETFDAVLKELSVYAKGENISILQEKGYYGEYDGQILKLNPIEALLLLERNRIRVFTEENQELSFKELSEYFVNNIPNFWTKFLVYKDLRSRGYIVRQGFGEDIEFRVYDRGAEIGKTSAKYLIHPVIEGRPLNLIDLSQITRIAKSSRKKLVLTVVDRQGEVTYYQCKDVLF